MAAEGRNGNRHLNDPRYWSMPNTQPQLHAEWYTPYVLCSSWKCLSSNLKQDRNILNSSKTGARSVQGNSGWPLRALGCCQAGKAGGIAVFVLCTNTGFTSSASVPH